MLKNKKIIYLEILRIICCVVVIFGHTGTKGYFLFSNYKYGGLQFWIYLFVSIFIYFVVPTFFAISGAVLLNKENSDSIKLLYKKRIKNTVIVLIIFSFLYFLYECYLGNSEFNLEVFLTRLYSNQWCGAYYFVYMYLAYLLCFPILNLIAKNMKDKHFYYIFGLSVIFQGIIPICEYLLWQGSYTMNPSLNTIWFASNIVVCPLIGYFIHNCIDIKKLKKILPIMWIINVIAVIICCLMTYYKINLTGECSEAVSQTFHNCFSLIYCATIFATFKILFNNKNFSNNIIKFITKVSGCTFGVYLIHLFIMHHIPLTNKIASMLSNSLKNTPMLSSIIYCLLIFVISCSIVYLFKTITIKIKKLIKNKN